MGPPIEKFECKNYMLWKLNMQILLQAKELWGLIDMTWVKQYDYDVATITNYTKKENKARNFLVQNLFDSQFMIVQRETIAH